MNKKYCNVAFILSLSLSLLFLYRCADNNDVGESDLYGEDEKIIDIGYEDYIRNDLSFVEDIEDTFGDELNQNIVDTLEPVDVTDISDVGVLQSPMLVTNKDYLPLLKKIIQDAKNNIIILHQEFLTGSTLDQLQNDLVAAKKRGVNVRVLLERDVEENAQRVESLKSNGIDAALDSSSKTLHLKLVLSDNRHILLGSTNLSYSSFQYNNEVNVYVDDSKTVQKFYDYANSILLDNSKLAKVYCTDCEFVPIGDAQYSDIVVPIINNAKKYVFVIMYQYSYDTDISTPNGKITNALIDAKSRGVLVKVLLEYSSFDYNLNTVNQRTSNYLKEKGIEVRMDSKEIVTHAKLLIADDVVVVYSGNWVYSSLSSNHEVGLVLRNESIKTNSVNYFNALYNSAK